MDQVWNDINWPNSKYWKKKQSQCHFVHHKFNIEWPGIKPMPLW